MLSRRTSAGPPADPTVPAPVVLWCGTPPPQTGLPALDVVDAEALPARDQIDRAVAAGRRIVVLGDDAALAAVLTRLMRTERLDVELAYAAPHPTAATKAYRLPTGAKAVRAALTGDAVPVPLIRDDTGVALVGVATLTGPGGGDLVGETYVDDHRLYTGRSAGVEIRPLATAPGLRAAEIGAGRLASLRRRRPTGRAAQTGAVAARLVRDGMPAPREVTRSTFYRHTDDWLLVGAPKR